jgi:hypothetical protein
MRPDDRQHTVGALVVPVTARVRRLDEGVQGDKALTMGDLTAELPPQLLKRVQLGAVGGQVQQHQPPSRGADDGLDFIIEMGVGIIPGHIDGAGRMAVDKACNRSATARRHLRRRNSTTVSPVWPLTVPSPYRLYGCPEVGIMTC